MAGPAQRAEGDREAEQASQHRDAQHARDMPGLFPALPQPGADRDGADRGDREGRRPEHEDGDGGERDRGQAQPERGPGGRALVLRA
jgi:hypothetical protein